MGAPQYKDIRVMASNNIISFGSRQYNAPTRKTPQTRAIRACRHVLKESLSDCFNFFNSLDDSLFKLADQAENNQQQDEYFVIMRQFRIKKDDIKQQFTQLTLEDFDTFWQKPLIKVRVKDSEPSNMDAGLELSLMQNDALEQDIALKQIATKGDLILGGQLHRLDRRFSHLLSSEETFENPLSSDYIAKNVKKIISPITSNIAVLLLTYKQFEQFSLPLIVQVYEDLNAELIEHDILPTLNHKVRKSLSRNAPAVSTHALSSNNPITVDDIDASQEDDVIFDDILQLLTQISNRSVSTHPNSGPPATLDTVIAALSNLQQQRTQLTQSGSGAVTLPNLHQSLLTLLNQTKADGSIVTGSLSRIDEDTMNVIALLFEFILEDRAIPAPIRALLARLQLPMLKVAITDKTFFSKKSHVTRLLLNNLARASTGWDHSNGHQDILFSKIESIVTSILTDFDTDMQIFSDLNNQLTQFMQQQEKNSNFSEKRIAKATEGQERVQLAQQEVGDIINQLMTRYSPVPKAVVTLIEVNWKQILRLRFLQKGKDSSEWKNAVSLMEELLWSVAPKSDPADRKKLLETIPKLLKSLRHALSGPSFNQHKITALFRELQQCHIKCLNGDKLEADELQAINKQDNTLANVDLNSETLTPIPESQKVMSDEEALTIAKQLKIGTWLEITKNDQVQRIKFSWRSNLTGRCLFVTYQGLKAAEVALNELASWFQQGQAAVLDQAAEPLMDRALVSMKETIEHQDEVGKAY